MINLTFVTYMSIGTYGIFYCRIQMSMCELKYNIMVSLLSRLDEISYKVWKMWFM